MDGEELREKIIPTHSKHMQDLAKLYSEEERVAEAMGLKELSEKSQMVQ